ncbi:hypothetical protein MLD38_018207 [Melastoma candidum]|uniref:Uncharacterized protein n=1 Tax=Melastoma candidum TaxID=119954 RepID=A0ACB9QU75_9MYRT|nr:hypothetical protein MLD38_018207 [Melastoma candidum]
MLNLVNEKGEDEDVARLGDSRREPLAWMIEDFLNKYHSLYEQYDSLASKLKEKARSRRCREGAADDYSSSDSDSDDFLEDKGSENGRLDGDSGNRVAEFEEELRGANSVVEELKREMSGVVREEEACRYPNSLI